MKRGRCVESRGSGLNFGANGGLQRPDVAPGPTRGFSRPGAEGHVAMETLILDPGVPLWSCGGSAVLLLRCREVIPEPSSELGEFLVDLVSGD